jgi:hypothetical protein
MSAFGPARVASLPASFFGAGFFAASFFATGFFAGGDFFAAAPFADPALAFTTLPFRGSGFADFARFAPFFAAFFFTLMGASLPRLSFAGSSHRGTLLAGMTGDAERPRLSPTARNALFSAAFVIGVAALALIFRSGFSTNPGSRVLTVLAVVENGSLRADEWFDLTIDRAIVNGHNYSDKAPLSSFVVIPFYWVWRHVEGGPQTRADIDAAVLLGDVVAAAIPFGAFALLLYRRAARGIPSGEAVFVALLAASGTSLLSYAGTYFGHALSSTLFVFSYAAATRSPAPRALLAGVLAGLAVLTELPVAIGAVSLGVFLVARPGGVKLALGYAAGGLPFALVLGLYNAAITGSALDPPYNHLTSTFYTMHPYALDLHTLAIARDLLVSQYRGLFFYAPALILLAPLAVVRAETSARRWLLVGFVGAYFLFVASFWVWDGGWCVGPRHLAPIMIVLLYEGVDALARSAPGQRLPFVGLAAAGVAINVIAVATNPIGEASRRPFSLVYWPAFARGEIEPDNVFQALGHPCGRWSVVIWGALFLALGVVLSLLAPRAPGREAQLAAS